MYLPSSSEWNNRAHSSVLELLEEIPHKGELRLTSGRYPSGTKITKEETGSNPYCSAAAVGDPQASRVWSGHQQSYSRGA